MKEKLKQSTSKICIEKIKQIAQQVRDDMTNSIAPRGRGLGRGGNPLRKVAFTLAEVLITLGIIGVVATLTLPSLIQKYQDHVLETRLKKMYTTLSQGMQKAMADDGVSNFSDTELAHECAGHSTSAACVQAVKKYFNVVAVKTSSNREYYGGVVQTKYGEYIDGDFHNGREILGHYRDKSRRYSMPWPGYSPKPTYVLADGSEFMFKPLQGDLYIEHQYADFTIDTNGSKGPNAVGFDIFYISFEDGKLLKTYNGDLFQVVLKNNWKFPW